MNEHKNFIVVGAGLSGVSISSLLAQRGHKVTLLEKARGIGGRLARWTSENLGSDTLPYHRLHQKLGIENFDLFKNKPLNFILKTLLAQHKNNISLQLQKRVINLCYSQNTWTVQDDKQEEYRAKYLILCLPLPQIQEMLKEISLPWPEVQYQSLITLFTSKITEDLVNDAVEFKEIEDKLYKTILPGKIDKFPERQSMTQEDYEIFFQKYYRVPVLRAHFWRYAKAQVKSEFSQLFWPEFHLGFCSDWVAPGENLQVVMNTALVLEKQIVQRFSPRDEQKSY